mgnify:CR=1 FL=1
MGWGTLKEIRDFNREERDREARELPVECPHDGAVLVEGPRGRLVCPMGNYTYGG